MTATRYRPLDKTYPTNYPNSTDIPIPSGLLKDLGVNSLRILESNIKGARQGWCWTMARTANSQPSSSFSPQIASNNFTGYQNPAGPGVDFDFSTVGLQVSSQIASNSSFEPVVLAVPFSFSAMRKKGIRVGITGDIFAYSAFYAGATISVGYVGWDAEGNYFSRPPSDFSNACDPDQLPENVIFNRNPNFPDTKSTQYFDPVDTIASPLRYFELQIPYVKLEEFPRSGTGFILISIITWPGANPVPGGSTKVRGTDWDWLIFDGVVDPNHLVLSKAGFRYKDYFSDSTSNTQGDSGAKHIRITDVPISLMYKIRSPNTVTQTPDNFSYHSMMQFRLEGDATKGFTPNKSTNMIYPFIPNDWIASEAIYDQANWLLDVFPMSSMLISSIFIDEIPYDRDGNNLYTNDIDNYVNPPTTTGADGSADAYNRNVNSRNTELLQSPYAASNCNSRVKGRRTSGFITGVIVLEKNEAFTWSYYDPTITYGGLVVGQYLSVNYSTINFEGWNQGLGYVWLESTTPSRRLILGPDPIYGLDCQLDGNDQALDLQVKYPLSAGKTGLLGYNARLDRSIAYLPFNPFYEPETVAQGVPSEQYLKAGSFNTPGMLDRFYNTNVLQDYRLIFDLYPLTEAVATDFERASGFTNNYTTAGAISWYTIPLIWEEDLPSTRVQFLNPQGYGPFDLPDRGVLEAANPAGGDQGVTSLPVSGVYVVYGATYTSKYTQDPT